MEPISDMFPLLLESLKIKEEISCHEEMEIKS